MWITSWSEPTRASTRCCFGSSLVGRSGEDDVRPSMDAPRRARRADSFADPLVRPPPPASAPIWSHFLRPAKPTANGVPAAAEAPAAVPSAHHHPDRAPGGAREAGVEAKRASGHGDAGTRRDIDHPRRLAVDALRRR